jgi:hypothetical protein
MRRVAVFVAVFALLVAFAPASRVSADPGGEGHASGVTDPLILALIGDDDLFSLADLSTVLNTAPIGTQTNGTQHYGPFTSTSPDSGTCGNNWAEDTFDRHFTVRASGPDTFTVVEQFKNGSFVTTAGTSPGGCETDLGGTIVAGKTGSMHGYFIISNVGPQTSTSPFCDAVAMTNDDCTTTTFIDTHFTPCYFGGGGTCPVTTYFDHYAAGDQNLAVHEWKNASCDRGGDDGDIASTAGVRQKGLCP